MVDPASNWPLFAEKARQLLSQDKVAAVFGCWTSVSRKSVLPVFEELNGLLFYPVQYEGEEMSPNVFYTGAAPNQQAIPAVEYLLSEDGGGAKRFFLLGTDYVYPRTTNKILRAFLHSKGVQDKDIEEVTRRSATAITRPSSPTSEVCRRRQHGGDLHHQRRLQRTVLQRAGQPRRQGHRRAGDRLLGRRGRAARHRHPTAGGQPGGWNYFESLDNPTNKQFVSQWKAYAKAHNLPNYATAVTNDPMEATYVGLHMWAQAVEKAGTTDVDKVRAAMAGQTFAAPSGFTLTMDQTNHHLHKPVMIGEIEGNGQFNVVWQTEAPVRAQPWSPYIAGNDKKPDYPVKGGK